MGTQLKRVYLILLAFQLFSSSSLAVDEYADIKLIRELPSGDLPVRMAYLQAEKDTCELIPAGEPLEVTSIVPNLTVRDQRQKRKPLPASRVSFMTIGLELSQVEQGELPLLSGGTIQEFLETNYVILQARVRRDLLDRNYYYHHRPIAVAAHFHGPRVTQKFEALVAKTTANIVSLGVFVPAEVKLMKAEHLRTLVLLYHNRMSIAATGQQISNYEWVFVRAREFGPSKTLQHNVFVTENNRKTLVRLVWIGIPRNTRQCSLVGQISITDYDSTGLYPKDSVTRSYRLAAVERFDWQALEQSCRQKYAASIGKRLDRILDDIISGEFSEKDFNH